MKAILKNTKKAAAYIRYFDAEFYAVRVYSDSIQLQGKFSTKITLKAKASGFTQTVDTSGYLNYDRRNVNITLTN